LEGSRKFLVLITPWPSRLPDRRLLRELFRDLRDHQISVLPLPPLGPPWILDEWLHRYPEIDFDEWEYLFRRWWRHHPRWWKRYQEWRHELEYVLRHLPDRRAPRAVVLLAPFGEEFDFDQTDLYDLVRIVKPAVVIDLKVGEEDRRITEAIPDAKVLNYPEQRSEFLDLLRSLTGEPEPSYRERLSARLAMARNEFAQRTAEQKRPKITVAYPEAVAPSSWSTVDVFIYLRDYRELVDKEIRRLQDREDFDYTGISSEFPKSLPVGCTIRIILQSESLLTNPSEVTINWYEPYNRLPFRISPKDDNKDGYSASLDLDVIVDDLPVASLRLSIAVKTNVPVEHTKPAATDAAWYEDIFASYAREDLELVKHLKERYEALGLYMFIDLDDLRAGESWQDALFNKIDESDLFQLFWSEHARESKFVTVEWKHALSAREVKGRRFIRPVFWKEPIPEVPEELAEINFRKISFVES